MTLGELFPFAPSCRCDVCRGARRIMRGGEAPLFVGAMEIVNACRCDACDGTGVKGGRATGAAMPRDLGWQA